MTVSIKVTNAVHEKGSHIYLQIVAMGRGARALGLREESEDYDFVAPSPIPLKSRPDEIPRELTKDGEAILCRRFKMRT